MYVEIILVLYLILLEPRSSFVELSHASFHDSQSHEKSDDNLLGVQVQVLYLMSNTHFLRYRIESR